MPAICRSTRTSCIALCAPRPTFISYGVPEKGDAQWLDQQGSFMATVAAGPVFRLLGAQDLGTSDDYATEKMPPVNAGLLDGAARVAAARRRPHRRPELALLHPVGKRATRLAPADQGSLTVRDATVADLGRAPAPVVHRYGAEARDSVAS